MTEPDAYGVYRVYSTQPTYDPHDLFSLEDTCEAPTLTATADNSSQWWTGFGSALTTTEEFFAPFLNATVFHLMKWFYNGNNRKSLSDLDSLVQDVIQAPDFCSEDLATFRATREVQRLDEHAKTSAFTSADGWHETTVKIRLPPPSHDKQIHEDTAPEYTIRGVFYRKSLEVLHTTFRETAAQKFHMHPFQQFWQPVTNTVLVTLTILI